MERNLRALADETFDLVVIGGGATGSAIAWDAALRGLRVALLERGDFCQGTSAHSFRMVHGGIRYLQHFDLVRIRESVRERRALLRIAPHLVAPLPIAIPTFGHGLQGREALLAGMRLYQLCAADRNRGIQDPARRIPPGYLLSRRQAIDAFPVLEGTPTTGAGVFYDGQIYNPPRLILAFVKSAAGAGAIVANYVEVIRLLGGRDRIEGVEATDTLTGSTFRVRAKVVVNAAGGWAPHLLARAERPLSVPVTFSRDACFITSRPPMGSVALALLGGTRDPDAVLSRKARHLFLAPWRGHTMVGVWHRVFDAHPDTVSVQEPEIRSWIDEINQSCPALRLSYDEVTRYDAGLTLFGENAAGAKNLRYGHRSCLVDHAATDRIEGLVTAIGVRLTVARGVANDVIELVGRKLGSRLPPSRTDTTSLAGGDVADQDRFLIGLLGDSSIVLAEDILRSLARNYGSECSAVLDLVRKDARLGNRLGGSHVIRAQVVHAVRSELALSLSDVVYRRTDLGTADRPAEAALIDCAAVVAGELGWSRARVAAELERARATFPDPNLPVTPSPPASEVVRMAAPS